MYSLSPRIIKRPEGGYSDIFKQHRYASLFWGAGGMGGGSFKISIFSIFFFFFFNSFFFFFFFLGGGGGGCQKNVSVCGGGGLEIFWDNFRGHL